MNRVYFHAGDALYRCREFLSNQECLNSFLCHICLVAKADRDILPRITDSTRHFTVYAIGSCDYIFFPRQC